MTPDMILVDIDGVAAWKNLTVLLPLYNAYFKLALPDTVLQSVPDLRAFEQLEAVQTFRQRVGEQRYAYLMELVVYDPTHLQHAHVIAHAQEGITQLAQASTSTLAYCTARSGPNEQWNRGVRQATHRWLKEQSFPYPDQVLFCTSPRGKLETIVDQLHRQSEHVLLIDDSYHKLLQQVASFTPSDQALLQHYVTIGAYRSDQREWPDTPVRVVSLPQWSMIDQFLSELKKEVSYGQMV